MSKTKEYLKLINERGEMTISQINEFFPNDSPQTIRKLLMHYVRGSLLTRKKKNFEDRKRKLVVFFIPDYLRKNVDKFLNSNGKTD